MTRDAGYTLAETLAAMLIIGLAMGGLFEGSRLVARMQKPTATAVAEARMLRRAENGLAALLAVRPPDDRTLTGDAAGFTFQCSAGQCGASLLATAPGPRLQLTRGKVSQAYPLPDVQELNLVYDARSGRFDHWPLLGEPESLRGVAVIGKQAGGDVPIVAVSSWIEQSKTCEYDMVARACRDAPR